jgi:hypothetical protein
MVVPTRNSVLKAGGPFVVSLALLVSGSGPAGATMRDPFPDPRPADRASAILFVAGEVHAPLGCLTPQIEALRATRMGGTVAGRRALVQLQQRPWIGFERHPVGADLPPVTYTLESSAFDRVDPADSDGDGTPDFVQHVAEGLGQARSLLVEQLRLPEPIGLEVVLLELGPELDGYFLPREVGSMIVLDASPDSTPEATRNAAIHQYAHAVAHAAGTDMPAAWSEALAAWTPIELSGGPDGMLAGLFSARLERLDAGLLSPEPELAAGNAIWLEFLDEAYGPVAVSVTVEELARGGPVSGALDRALARVSDDDLRTAFREFHLWTVLVGPRADRYHFSFARYLAGPRFASDSLGLPALSVQADPAVAPWGATQIRIAPDVREGGLSLRFEGEIDARWEVDLVLIDDAGTPRRLALELSPEGQAENTVPLEDVEEALLLIRNVDTDEAVPQRYTYAAHRERAYPVAVAFAEVCHRGDAVDLAWDTRSETDLIGFNVLRSREAGGSAVVANPVWIPAMGEGDESVSYQFVDRGVKRGVSYVYRVQAITLDGLTSHSDPIVARPAEGR